MEESRSHPPATSLTFACMYEDADFVATRRCNARNTPTALNNKQARLCPVSFPLNLMQIHPQTCGGIAFSPGTCVHAGGPKSCGHRVFYIHLGCRTNSATHPSFRFWKRRVLDGHSLLSGEPSVSSTAGRLGSTEADLTKSSTAGGDGDFPATIMYCKI